MTRSEALGRPFAVLWTAAGFSNLADGIARLAVPLIATSMTRDPLAISVLGALVYVPWLLFGIPSGTLIDRFDRRRILALANVVRTGTALVLAVLTVTGQLTLPILVVATLVFGLGEVLFDNATLAMLPSVVRRSGLDRANSRIQAVQIAVDGFIAAPIGGVLYAIALALPLWVGAAGYLVPIALALLLPLSAARAADAPVDDTGRSTTDAGAVAPSATVAAPVSATSTRAAVRWLWRHRYLRGLVLLGLVVSPALAFAQAAILLLFLDRLGVTEAAIGVVTAGVAAGALLGAIAAPACVRRWGRGPTMLVGLVGGGVGMVLTGVAPHVLVAVIAFGAGAGAVSLWNVPSSSLRQQLVPGAMLGRVVAVTRTASWCLTPLATLAGGWVARADLGLPFVIGGAITTVATLVAAPLIIGGTRRVEAELAASDAEPGIAEPGLAAQANSSSSS